MKSVIYNGDECYLCGSRGTEVWRPIHGYEGLYEVSNHGHVRSLQKTIVQHFKNGKEKERKLKSRNIALINNGNGYIYVSFMKHGKRKNFYVHRLVADAFIEKPEGKDFVNHIDYDRSNNHVDNLEWCTVKENVRHSVEKMRHPKTVKRNHETGEKRISKRDGRYRFQCDHLKIDKMFNTLQEAINYRDEVFNEIGYSE